MNTWFQKKRVLQYGTWMHPATKQVHMIDLVVMKMSQRMYCRDVQVMRGASCWTDHKLVRARFSFQLYGEGMRREKKALPFSVYKLESAAVRDKFRCCLENHLLDQRFLGLKPLRHPLLSRPIDSSAADTMQCFSSFSPF